MKNEGLLPQGLVSPLQRRFLSMTLLFSSMFLSVNSSIVTRLLIFYFLICLF